MRYAILSTVCSGRMNYDMAADAVEQPRLAQLAFIVLQDDGVLPGVFMLIKPDGWKMDSDTVEATGVTTELLNRDGVPVGEAIKAYANLIETGHVIAAYGAAHHLKLMRGEMRRAGVDDLWSVTQYIDIMRAMTTWCAIPNKNRKGYKFPKFEEACAFIGAKCPTLRAAPISASLTWQMFEDLRTHGLLPLPKTSDNEGINHESNRKY